MVFTKKISVTGMHCSGCETIIEESVGQIDGVQNVKANYSKGIIKVRFDLDKTNLDQIHQAIFEKGYTVISISKDNKQQVFKIVLSILALAILFSVLMIARKLGHQIHLPDINSRTSDGLIFVIGLLTGLHCIGMCGSFIIGYTAKDTGHERPAFRSHLLYGVGKTTSYALFGALFGFIGSMFQITPLISGISIGIAGAFLILFGLNMLNIFPFFKAIRIKQPRFLKRLANRKGRKTRSPFFIGFFSGLILGCGPLQAMYVMAAGNGHILEGAKFLALFGLGTLPALLGFGLIASLLSGKMTRSVIRALGIILIVLGSMMLSKGIVRSGLGGKIESEQAGSCCHASVK